MSLKAMTLPELLVLARGAEPSPVLARQLRDLLVENGPLLQVLCGFLEARDSLLDPLAMADITSEEARAKVLRIQGQIVGIDTCLNIIHMLMSEGTDDHA